MAEQAGGTHRRRRRRADADEDPQLGQEPGGGDDAGVSGAATTPAADPTDSGPQPPAPSRRPAKSGRDSADRGLRELVGAGRSQLGVSGALRGRDVNRPTEEDLAEAEAELVIVRRHWKPPAKGTQPPPAKGTAKGTQPPPEQRPDQG